MKFFYFFDYVGYKPEISIYGSNRHKTFLGTILGFISAMSIIGISIYFTKTLFERKEISIIENDIRDASLPVNMTNSIFYFNILDGKNTPINTKFFEIKMDLWDMVRKEPDGPLVPQITHILLNDCTNEQEFGNYKNILSIVPLEGSKCLSSGKYNLSLHGKYGDFQPFSFINVAINFCNNKTNNFTCPSFSEMASVLKNVYLHYAFVEYELNHNDLNNPLKKYLKYESPPINWDLHIRYYQSLEVINYSTDFGFFFEDYELHSGYRTGNSDQSVSIRHGSTLYPDITFATLTFIRDTKTRNIFKSFLKIQNLLAKIGGILNALNFIFRFVCSMLTKNLFYTKILNDYISSEDFHPKEQNLPVQDLLGISRQVLFKKESINKMYFIY
jgi:hypothetical protein